MAEEPQELTVTNTGQPLVVEIDYATSDENPQAVTIIGAPANQTVTIDPSSD